MNREHFQAHNWSQNDSGKSHNPSSSKGNSISVDSSFVITEYILRYIVREWCHQLIIERPWEIPKISNIERKNAYEELGCH